MPRMGLFYIVFIGLLFCSHGGAGSAASRGNGHPDFALQKRFVGLRLIFM